MSNPEVVVQFLMFAVFLHLQANYLCRFAHLQRWENEAKHVGNYVKGLVHVKCIYKVTTLHSYVIFQQSRHEMMCFKSKKVSFGCHWGTKTTPET